MAGASVQSTPNGRHRCDRGGSGPVRQLPGLCARPRGHERAALRAAVAHRRRHRSLVRDGAPALLERRHRLAREARLRAADVRPRVGLRAHRLPADGVAGAACCLRRQRRARPEPGRRHAAARAGRAGGGGAADRRGRHRLRRLRAGRRPGRCLALHAGAVRRGGVAGRRRGDGRGGRAARRRIDRGGRGRVLVEAAAAGAAGGAAPHRDRRAPRRARARRRLGRGHERGDAAGGRRRRLGRHLRRIDAVRAARRLRR